MRSVENAECGGKKNKKKLKSLYVCKPLAIFLILILILIYSLKVDLTQFNSI